MHTFTVRKTEAPRADLSRFSVLAPSFHGYIADTFDLVELKLNSKLLGEPRFYLGLNRLSLLPGRALLLLGCENARDAMRDCEYRCGLLGGYIRHSFVPLGIVATSDALAKYLPALAASGKPVAHELNVLPDLERFETHLLEEADLSFDKWVNRAEQLYLGSGLTWRMLSEHSHESRIEPVSLALSNGDTLMGFAYATTSKEQV